MASKKVKLGMTEDQYQLGIRKLSPHEMVSLITRYRNQLKGCLTLFDQILKGKCLHNNMIMEEIIRCTAINIEVELQDFNKALEEA